MNQQIQNPKVEIKKIPYFEISNIPGGLYHFEYIDVLLPPKIGKYYKIGEISRWKLDEIPLDIINWWNTHQFNEPPLIQNEDWRPESRQEIIKNLVPLRDTNHNQTWIGVPTQVMMGYQSLYKILPFVVGNDVKTEFVQDYLVKSPKFIKGGEYTTWKALTEYQVVITLMETKNIIKDLAPHQLFNPVTAKHKV